jgi:hypothetical protein
MEMLESRLLLCGGIGPDNGSDDLIGSPAIGTFPPLQVVDHGTPTNGSGTTTIAGGSPLSSVPQLNSLPGAKASLYLNFTGDFTASWGGHTNITTPAYDIDGDPNTFSQTELNNITKIWQYVAEDYAPFNINVTTVTPANLGHGYTMKIDIGGNGAWTGGNYGGISYIGSFTNSASNVSFVFPNNLANGNPKDVGDASSHEAGHGFGLQHQSLYNSSGQKVAEYYSGPGDGTAPIMGNSYNSPLSRWWTGTASDSVNHIQADMAVIGSATNGFGFRDDSSGNNIATAFALTNNNGQVSGSGIVISATDADYWSFATGAGQITLNLNVAQGVNDLVGKIQLVDANGNVIATGDANSGYNATLTANVQAGTYYVVAESHGGYGDVGQYTISGSVVPTTVTVPATPTGLNATAGDTQVSLTWNSSPGATSYNVYRSLTPGGEGAIPYKTSLTTTQFTDTGLTDGTTYYYKVTAVNSAGESSPSSEVSATPQRAQFSLAIDSGGGATGSFVSDRVVSGGLTYSTNATISTSGVTNPAPQGVYQTERYGNFTYKIPGLTAGATYTVRLHFAEIYWGAAGKRLFSVKINGSQVLTSFDIYATAGGKNKAVVEQFSAVADASGNITIQYISVKDNAKSSGIEILTPAAAATAGGTLSHGPGATLAQNLGWIAQFFGSNPSYNSWVNWATAVANNHTATSQLLSQLSGSVLPQKTLEQWLGGAASSHAASTSHASADWTGDLLVNWKL